ncbi:MAG: hypothetical protein NTX98_03170 [Candidatus Doudnabacteria bacterium]|nr:hypothetical protein [Candidatus Doudnabacteria bacterium]
MHLAESEAKYEDFLSPDVTSGWKKPKYFNERIGQTTSAAALKFGLCPNDRQ